MNLDLLCAKDELRPAMCHVFITAEVMVATDAHVLGVIPTEELFDEEFISKIPEGGFLMHPEDFKKVVAYKGAFWKTEGTIKLIDPKKRDIIIEAHTEEAIGKYPNWAAVIPGGSDCTAEISSFGIDASLAARLQKALGFKCLKMQFSGVDRAARCTDNGESFPNRYGIIMPVGLK